MNEKSNNRKERTTVFNYLPHPVKKRFLAFLFAAALSVAFAGCRLGGDGGIIASNPGGNTPNDPGGNTPSDPGGNTPSDPGGNTPSDPGGNTPTGSDYTVSYQTENGTGSPPQTQVITKNTTIALPNETNLIAPQGAKVLVGWSDEDGMLTYPINYPYTVTKDVTFKARWAFDAVDKIEAYLNAATSDPVLIAVADGPDKSLTWKNLLLVIEAAEKEVELDLSGSTLALFGTDNNKFDYKDGQQNAKGYETGEKYIKKLILPRGATSITSVFYQGPFSILEEVSGLNVSAIPNEAFAGPSTLAAVAFPAATSIGTSAFGSCSSLTSVSLPAAETIYNFAFGSCSSLTSVSLPVAETIYTQAFIFCDKLTSVGLPAAKSIGTEVFRGCTSLTSVSLPVATTIGVAAFYQSGLTSVSLPAATTIGSYAFERCTSLTSVSLPVVGTIKSSAFSGCSSLTSITIAADCGIDSSNDTPAGFIGYYNNTKSKAAGVYTYSDSNWNYAPLTETS